MIVFRNYAGTRVRVLSIHYFELLMPTHDNSLVAYGNKMVNDLFDGTVGFAIDGGIKDAKLVLRGARNEHSFLILFPIQSHPPLVRGAELPDACGSVQFDLQESLNAHSFHS
jgi:hypothetical protein